MACHSYEFRIILLLRGILPVFITGLLMSRYFVVGLPAGRINELVGDVLLHAYPRATQTVSIDQRCYVAGFPVGGMIVAKSCMCALRMCCFVDPCFD